MGISNNISVEIRHGFIWVILPDTVTMDNYKLIEDKIRGKLTGKNDRVALDFSDTENIYSSGIGLLIRLHKLITESGGSFVLVNVSEKMRTLLREVNLDMVISIYATDVEFEISRDDIWKGQLSCGSTEFICFLKTENGICNIVLNGSMNLMHDLSSIKDFVPEQSVSKYIFNLENLELMDTYGFQVFFDVIKKIQDNNGKCAAYGANHMVLEFINTLSTDKIIQCYKTEKEAVDCLNN